MKSDFRIILSRTDSIGDVVLTLPMAGVLKKNFPQCHIIFLGRKYTRDVVALSRFVDTFADYDETGSLSGKEQVGWLKKLNADIIVHVLPLSQIASLAKKAGIKTRVGTTNRLYHWLYCNKLLSLSRKNSSLHEAQLNIRLLDFLSVKTDLRKEELVSFYGFRQPEAKKEQALLVDRSKFNLILHPKSKGSAREWGLANFAKLVSILPAENFRIFISGTAEDKQMMQDFLTEVASFSHVQDITGKFSLSEFISFIGLCDGLLAASTGPLHIAAALGKKAVGLFSSRRPIHPGRWAPVGTKAVAIVHDPGCPQCLRGLDCDCITRIEPEKVKFALS